MDNSDQEKMSAQSSYNNMQDNVHFPQFPLLASASALRFVYMRHITDASLFHHISSYYHQQYHGSHLRSKAKESSTARI